MNKLLRLLPVIAMALPLSGCTLLSTGLADHPAGIHPQSFRECLLDNGFFGPTMLSGTSYTNFTERHRDDVSDWPPAQQIAKTDSATFVAMTTARLYQGLMPHLQYGGGTEAAEQAPVYGAIDNRPYVENAGRKPYPKEGYPLTVAQGNWKAGQLDMPANRYLDCYVAPVGIAKANRSAATSAESSDGGLITEFGDQDIEGRLLRAHIILALFADYGLELISSHHSSREADQASRLLKHIRIADAELRKVSPSMSPNSYAAYALARRTETDAKIAQTNAQKATSFSSPTDLAKSAHIPFEQYGYAIRVLRVFQAGVDLQMIDAQQSFDRVSNILAAFSSANPGAFKSILKDAVSGFASVQKIGLFGDALLRDARGSLATHRAGLTYDSSTQSLAADVKLTRRLWVEWDGHLDAACNHLARLAKEPETGCSLNQADVDKQTEGLLKPFE